MVAALRRLDGAVRLASALPQRNYWQAMTSRDDAPQDNAGASAPPEVTEAGALPPAVWVTCLIVVVLLLLAVFGLA
jgi:hypothetical protein